MIIFRISWGSFLLSHSQLLLCSAASDSTMMVYLSACPWIPICLRSLVVRSCGYKASAANLHWERQCSPALLHWLRWYTGVRQPFAVVKGWSTLSTNASNGTVSSTMYYSLFDVDHKIRSGLRLNIMISAGKESFLSRSVCIFQSWAVASRSKIPCSAGFLGNWPADMKAIGFFKAGCRWKDVVCDSSPSFQDASYWRTRLCLQV